MNTIATHNGSKLSQEHNRREYDEPHIDRNGLHESWVDIPVSDAYKGLFGMALLEYNEKQTHADRRIDDYYEHIRNKKNQHVAYEMIVGVYSDDGAVTEEQSREILKEFVSTWTKRNPNLFLCGAYYHADEKGQAHVHIDYIPVAHECKRGLRTQTNLTKALGEMGMKTSKGKGTAQEQMQRANNEYLEELCVKRGIEISHPGGKNLGKEAYIASKEKERLEAEVKSLENKKSDMTETLGGLERQLREANADIAERKKSVDREIDEYRTNEQRKVQEDINTLTAEKNALEAKFGVYERTLDNIVRKVREAVPENEKQQSGIIVPDSAENALEAKFEASTGMLERWSNMLDEQDEKLKKREADVAEREKKQQSVEALENRQKNLRAELEKLKGEANDVQYFLDMNYEVREPAIYESMLSSLGEDKARLEKDNAKLEGMLAKMANFIVNLMKILEKHFPKFYKAFMESEERSKYIEEVKKTSDRLNVKTKAKPKAKERRASERER